MKFEDFIRQGIYLKGWSLKTVRTYRQGLNAFQMAFRETGFEPVCLVGRNNSQSTTSESCNAILPLTKAHLDTFVISLRQRGMAAGGCNMYIRTVNSYLTWLEEGLVLLRGAS